MKSRIWGIGLLKRAKQIREKEYPKNPSMINVSNTGTVKPAISQKEGFSEGKEYKVFFSLKWRLVSVITLIVVVALGGMNLLASYFFRNDTTIRIEERNQSTSLMVATQFEQNLANVVNASYTLLVGASNIIPDRTRSHIEYFFANNPDILYIGIATYNIHYTNSTVLYREQLTPEYIQESLLGINDLEYRVEKEGSYLFNASPIMGFPSMGIAVPYEQNQQIQTLIILIDLREKMIALVETRGLILTSIINIDGDVLIDADQDLLNKGATWKEEDFFVSINESGEKEIQSIFKDKTGESYLIAAKRTGIGHAVVLTRTNAGKAYEAVDDIITRNFVILGIVCSLVILIVYFMAKGVVKPLIALVFATNKIQKGDFDIDVEMKRKDEVGNLSNAFQNMSKGLAERERIKDAFGRFVNKEVADLAAQGALQIGGETKNAAVFFSDIRDFTAICEQLEAREVVEFLNDYMSRMVKCVNDSGGVVDKFIGDAVMALWGVPVSRGDDVKNAIQGALLMRDALIEFNQNRGDPGKPIIRIGCGINYGSLIAGQIGSDERMEYTVIGDTVNLASRIEALNKPMGTDILVSQVVGERIKNDYFLIPMNKILVKGKKEPQQIFAVLGRKGDPATPEDLSGLREKLGIKGDFSGVENLPEEHEDKYEIIN